MQEGTNIRTHGLREQHRLDDESSSLVHGCWSCFYVSFRCAIPFHYNSFLNHCADEATLFQSLLCVVLLLVFSLIKNEITWLDFTC